MKSSITIHHGNGKCHEWLKELIGKHFDQIVEAVEEKVKKERTGLPWRKEERDDLEEGFSWELREGFEVTMSFMKDDKTGGGASWILHDFWCNQGNEPPPKEKDG